MAWKLKDNIPPEPASVTDLIEGDLEEVTELVLTSCELRSLPDDLGRLVNLYDLDVSQNALKSLPNSIGRCRALSRLILTANIHLSALPSELAQLPDIQELDIYGTSIRALPSGLEAWSLRSLSLSMLPKNLPTWSLQRLELWEISEADIKEILLLFPALEELVLGVNGLHRLPSVISRLPLRRLHLYAQDFAVFPDLRSVSNLEELVVGHCGVESLPDWIGNLRTLSHLTLSYNQLETLPRQLADLGDDLDLDLSGNPLTSPLDEFAKQGTPALFAYLRSLPDDLEPEIAPDPAQAAEAAPQPQIAPLAARIEGDRLVPMPAPAPLEADQAELQAMHAETLDWARQTLERTGNHPLLTQMVKRCVTLLGDHVQALQVLPLAFANDRLRQVLEDTAASGDDPLSGEQRGMCNGLVGNIKMLLNWSKEWKDYKLKTRDDHYDAQATEQVRQALVILAQHLEPQKQAVEASLPPAIADLAEAARPGQPPEMVHGAVDGLNNMLSPLARHGLLKLTDKDKEEIRKTVVQTGTKAVLAVGSSLALVAAAFILGHAADLLALAHALPLDYGWLRQVIAALRGLING